MKPATAFSLLAVCLSALAVLLFVLDRPKEGGAGVESLGAPPADWAVDWAQRLDELEAENLGLRQRLSDLEMRPVGERAVAFGPSEFALKRELEALRDLLEGGAIEPGPGGAKKGGGNGELSPEFVQSVGQAMRLVRKQEALAASQEYVARKIERLSAKLPGVAQELGLTPVQQADLTSALENYYAQEPGYKAAAIEQGREAAGELWRSDLEALRGELQGFMSEEQYAAYVALGGDLFPDGRGK